MHNTFLLFYYILIINKFDNNIIIIYFIMKILIIIDINISPIFLNLMDFINNIFSNYFTLNFIYFTLFSDYIHYK